MTAESPDGSPPPELPRTGEIDLTSADLTPTEVNEFVQALDKAVRARRLYAPNNPAYISFLAQFRTATKALWDGAHSVSCVVEETGFRWEGQLFTAAEARESVAFQFYKDGIRLLTFLPGFEEEIERFLNVIARAKQIDANSADDMVTILWEQEFTALQYSYVDALAEGIVVPETGHIAFDNIELTLVAEDASSPVTASDSPIQPYSVERKQPAVAQSILREDFSETLYFLDDKELKLLQQELEREWTRNTKGDVLNALFDRLEDPMPTRQTEILHIVRQLLPAYLSSGDLRAASTILIELNQILQSDEVLNESQKQDAHEIFAELSEPGALNQLLKSLEEGVIEPSGEELRIFLRYLRPHALALLTRATETTRLPELQTRLRAAIEGLGREHPEMLIQLVKHEDEIVIVGATRLIGHMALASAAPAVGSLLTHPATAVRRTAVEALVEIKTGAALDALQRALDDVERDVRIAAARGLSALRYPPARKRLEEMLDSRIVRDADLTEKIAFFEAFGAVASADSVAMLDRILNGKKLFAKETPELRACAAMALGKVGSPAARQALQRAVEDKEPMVRNAVQKALRQEVTVA